MIRQSNKSLGCGILIGVVICILAGSIGALFYFVINPKQTPPSLTETPQMLFAPSEDTPSALLNNENAPQPAPTYRLAEPDSLTPVPIQAVVKVSAMVNGEEVWYGSGTVISPDGLILTNAHVVMPEKPYNVEQLLISFTGQEDKPPQPAYYAEIAQADLALDIAVLRITSDLNGAPVDHTQLDLTAAPLGNSDELHIGSALTILGYPNIGGATITLTRGDVAGFTTDAQFGDRAFIKTSATITGGNSGGLGANAKGELVGVPTQLGYGGDDQFVDCRPLADTNRDGAIDSNDNCVPTGGFINALRPINLALPLIEAARRGEVAIASLPSQSTAMSEVGQPIFMDEFVNPASGWDDRSGPSGTTQYLNGQYVISVNPPQTLVWSRPKKQFEDVILKVTAQASRFIGNEDYGFLCHYVDQDNFYALEISLDGYAAIWKIVDGERSYLIDWQPSTVIPTNGDAVTLTGLCSRDGFALAVDGNVVAEVQDASWGSGDVGLLAGTWDAGGVTVVFDNFAAYQP